MTTRRITYATQLAQSLQVLTDVKQNMVDLSILAQAILGTSELVTGFAVTPTGPVSLSVVVGPGTIFDYVNVDATAFGTPPTQIPADTVDNVLKYAYNLGSVQPAAIVPPSTVGFSRADLVQIGFSEADGNSQNIPFWGGVTIVNISGTNVPIPNPPINMVVNTQRIDSVVIQILPGTAATTGTQVPPSPSAGFIGVAVVTTAHGQTTITTNDITAAPNSAYPNSPIITETLQTKISQAYADTRYARIQQAAYYSGIMNGGMTIAQRETDDLSNTLTYGLVDTFYAYQSGGTVTVGADTITQGTGQTFGLTGYTFLVGPVTITGSGIVHQGYRMESNDAVNYRNQFCSVSMIVFQDTGSTINYVITAGIPTVKNNFGSVVLVATGSPIAVPSGVATLISLTNFGVGDSTNGIQIEIAASCGAVTAKNFHVTNFMINTGGIAIPFVPQDESAARYSCRRRYQKSYPDGVPVTTNTEAGLVAFTGNFVAPEDSGTSVNFTPSLIKSPSFSTWSIAGTAGKFTTGAATELSFATLAVSANSWIGYNAGTNGAQDAGFYHYEAIADL